MNAISRVWGKKNVFVSPLHLACTSRNKEIVEFLLNEDPDPTIAPGDGNSPIKIVGENYSFGVVQILIRCGASNNSALVTDRG